MKKPVSIRIIIIALFLLSAAFVGCSRSKSIANVSLDTFSSVTKRFLPGENTLLKKRVLVLNFVNQPEIEEDMINQLTDNFLRALKEDDSLLISTPERSIPTTISKDSSQYGVIIDPMIVKKAEEMNIDILIMPTLNPIDVSVKKKGIWPFRKLKRELELFISITVLDVTDGTLFLTNMEKRKIKLKDEVWDEDTDNWELDEEIVVEKSIPLLEDHASAIHKVLKGKPWTGRITLIEGTEITINAGQEIGITKGMTFEVFGKGDPIRAFNGNEYFTRGPKSGEVRISLVKQDYSKATPLSGDQLDVGQTIRLIK